LSKKSIVRVGFYTIRYNLLYCSMEAHFWATVRVTFLRATLEHFALNANWTGQHFRARRTFV